MPWTDMFGGRKYLKPSDAECINFLSFFVNACDGNIVGRLDLMQAFLESCRVTYLPHHDQEQSTCWSFVLHWDDL